MDNPLPRPARKSALINWAWLDAAWLQRRLANIARRRVSPEVRAWLRGQAVLRVMEAYAAAVTWHRIPAGKWVQLAVKRQRRDLARARRDRDWPYVFDPVRAGQVVNFFRLLQHIKGPLAKSRAPIALEPWQVFILACVFGWIHRETGLRRFRTVYQEVARKNGKSTMAAGICLYMLTADGEEGAEVYPFATTGDQAHIVFDVAKAMAQKEQRLRERLEIYMHNLSVPDTYSKMQPLNSKNYSNEGLNVSLGLADELHAHRTRGMYDVVENGMGAREQPLLWSITTAGGNQEGICYEQHLYVKKILQQAIEDDTYFGIIFALDEEDDWLDPRNWHKANPNLSVMPSLQAELERLAAKAKETPGAQVTFKTKRCNLWVGALAAYFNLENWKKAARPQLRREDLKGKPLWISADLATKQDVASRVDLFKVDGRYFLFSRHWLPEAVLVEDDPFRTRSRWIDKYREWSTQGFLQLTPGNIIDLDAIEEELTADAKQYFAREIPIDPGHQATQILLHLIAKGLNGLEYRNTVMNMSNPMKELKDMIDNGRLVHDGNPVMTWMISNVAAMKDRKNNVFPRQEAEENKIDGPVAAIMAMGRAMVDGGKAKHPYNDRGVTFL